MTFVPAPAAPAPAIADAIAGDGWWPDLSIAAFRDSTRLGTLVTDGRARDALIGGVISADTQLATWRTAQVAAGVANLAAVPGPSIGGVRRAVILWRRAVYAWAAADLAETHNNITATDRGRAVTEERATSADDHRRNAIIAVRDLLGETRSRAALL